MRIGDGGDGWVDKSESAKGCDERFTLADRD